MINETSNFIKEIKNSFFCDNEFISDVLKVKEKDLEQKLIYQNYNLQDLLNISDFFSINIDDLIAGNIDYNNLKKRFFTPSKSIPCIYQENAGTYMSNIRAIVNHIKNRTNDKTSQYIINRFGIAKEVLINDELTVNLKLANNLLEFIDLEFGLNDYDYIAMASLSYENKSRKSILKLGSLFSNDRQVAQMIIDNVSNYEKNFTYQIIDVTPNDFIIRGTSKPEAMELFKGKNISSMHGTKFRKASVQIITSFMGRELMNITHTNNYKVKNREIIDFHVKNNELSHIL